MQVRLVSITQSQIKTQDGSRFLSPEEHIVYCARVSNPSNQLNLETAPKLLAYCILNKHWSIFEQVDFGVEVVTSRAIAAQILRHRSFAFQEFSQRYSAATAFEPIELRFQAEKNRQSSLLPVTDTYLNEKVIAHIGLANDLYQELLENKVAKETARFILPLSTQTTLYMKGSVRSWIHYLQLRTDKHTQKEHQLVASEIQRIFIEQFPDISAALNWK